MAMQPLPILHFLRCDTTIYDQTIHSYPVADNSISNVQFILYVLITFLPLVSKDRCTTIAFGGYPKDAWDSMIMEV